MTHAIAIGPATPVAIGQIEWEFESVLELYRQRAPRRVLEIGTWEGGSLYHWLQNAQEGTRVVTVDVNPAERDFDEWCPAGVEWRQVVGDSHTPETVEQVAADGPYEWLFIDACHVYEDAKADWETFREYLTEDAVCLFHDISLQRDYPGGKTAGVWRLWREIQAEGYVTQEFRAHPNLSEYGIGVVFCKGDPSAS